MPSRYLWTILLCCIPVPAQGDTIPPGFESSESWDYASLVGAYADMRVQFATSLYRSKPILIKELQFRQDASMFSAANGVARKWTNVSVSVSDTDFSKLSSTFSKNQTSTPTSKFVGALSWPALTSRAPTWPAPWAANGLRVPFASNHSYTGSADLLFEVRFSGGVLGNAGAWRTFHKSYYLDAVHYNSASGGWANFYGKPHCYAYRSNVTTPDSLVFWHYSYARKTGNPANDDTMIGYFGHGFGSPSNIHIGALGLRGVTQVSQGIDVGACQPLMITPAIYISYKTDAFGRWNGPRTRIKYDKSLVGTRLWTQAVHDDGRAGLYLSRAHVTTIQRQPPDPLDYRMIYVTGSSTSPWGSLTMQLMPVIRLN